MPRLMRASDLEERRRLLNLSLRKIAERTGLKLATVWSCLHLRCPDVRKIIIVSKAIGVSPRRLDFESFVPAKEQNYQYIAPGPHAQAESQVCPPGRCFLSEKATATAAEAPEQEMDASVGGQ
jgi:hypothetical protein